MTTLQDLLNHRFLHNSLLEWGLAALAFLVPFVLLPVLRKAVIGYRRRKYEAQVGVPVRDLILDLLRATSPVVRLVVGLYLAEKALRLPASADHAFDVIIVFGVWWQFGLWATLALRFALQRRQQVRLQRGAEPLSGASVELLLFGGRILAWVIVTLLALENLGVNVTALVAGLGVGGIAIALAVQTVLGDVLASLSIALDRPFVVGDLVKLDDYEGVVEHIGIKSTRLRAVTGEQVIITNADMLKSRLRNLGRSPERRVQCRLRVAYDTPLGLVTQVPVLVEQSVVAVPAARFVACPLQLLGPYALEFELTYYVTNNDAGDVARAQDLINHAIVAAFATAGIHFAYPTQRNL
jgi:small-conductance mechanosensitive channel